MRAAGVLDMCVVLLSENGAREQGAEAQGVRMFRNRQMWRVWCVLVGDWRDWTGKGWRGVKVDRQLARPQSQGSALSASDPTAELNVSLQETVQHSLGLCIIYVR